MNLYKIKICAITFSAFFAVCCSASITAHESIVTHELEKISTYFKDANVVSSPKLVDCTLSSGTATTCFQITVKPSPKTYTPGPWCPRTIDDNADQGGIWLEEGDVYDVSGSFIEGMADFYADPDWQLYDADSGRVFVTDTLEKCAGAAKPNVDPEYRQHCVECQLSYLDEDATVTYTIPVEPILAKSSSKTGRSGSGLAFNGVRLDGPAPVADILGNYTIAPFDDCGGHVNLAVGYHYHAATDCLDDTANTTDHGSVVGIAMDGHLIYKGLSADSAATKGLDQCGGHADDKKQTYHYHAGAPGSNSILACLSGESGCVSSDTDATCDATAGGGGGRRGGGPRGSRPDFSKAAEKLGIAEDELMKALGSPPPNFDEAAKTLGVSPAELQEALGAKRGPKR